MTLAEIWRPSGATFPGLLSVEQQHAAEPRSEVLGVRECVYCVYCVRRPRLGTGCQMGGHVEGRRVRMERDLGIKGRFAVGGEGAKKGPRRGIE